MKFFPRLVLTLALIFTGSLVAQNNKYTLEIEVQNIKAGQGYLMVALHNKPGTFLNKNVLPYARRRLAANAPDMQLEFKHLPAGTYSITIYQDLNSNGELDTNLLGIPGEPFGFSLNPTVRFSPPGFQQTSFVLKNSQKRIIKLQD